ncbi:MAG: hypothetical protein ACJ76P_01345, partial [Actinomycetota bacterium]
MSDRDPGTNDPARGDDTPERPETKVTDRRRVRDDADAPPEQAAAANPAEATKDANSELEQAQA